MIRILHIQQFKPLTVRWLSKFAIIRFPLPDLGEKIKQGRIKKLHVRQGDRVSEFSKLADVQSDKQFTEITSPEGGIIKKIYYHEDQLCQVGDIFLDIDTNTSTTTQSLNAPTKVQQQPVFQQIQQSSLENQDYLASATIKMLAREQKIDLSKVRGSGRKGRILKEDLINYTENIKTQSSESKIAISKTIEQQKVVSVGQITKVSMSGIQKEMCNLSNYSCSVPHLYFQQNFEVTELLEITQKMKKTENRISLLSLLIKTFSLAVNKYPRVNSIYSLKNQFSYKQVPFQNLLLPIFNDNSLNFSLINNLEGRSIINIQDQLENLTKREISLSSINQNVSNATISLSSLGEIGGLSFNPLIYGEIACHAAIGQVRQKVISTNGTLKRSKSVEVVMGADHRVLDGATVGRFTMAWKQYSENPRLAFLNMI